VTHELAECANEWPTIADFKPDLCAALDDRFALSKADAAPYPFVTATVLDPATKPCELFLESLRFAAYGHVRASMSEAAALLQAETDGGDADESALLPAKRAKTDSQSASLKLPATTGYPGSDDRLITDYHVTMIGYGKKPSFTSLVL